ncbi:MAG: leucine-rich repeat protein [Paludibacteraceae bacterium]
MKRIHILLTLSLCLSPLTWAQGSGEGYDPENPGDPNVYYNLLLEASPRMGGTVSPSSQQLGFGERAYCSASAKTGYTFSRWMIGDSVVSTDRYFSFTMPDHDEVLTAYFDYTGYDPANPEDPFADGYQHKVTLYAIPSAGGSFNASSFYLTEGETTRVYAYPRNGYRFESWMAGNTVVSTANPMTIRMGQNDRSYTAVFSYNPENPIDPSVNMYDATTGTLVIDNFTPGSLNSAIRSVLGDYDNYATVRSITIIGQMTAEDFGFAGNFSACDTIDLSRTTGYTEIPSYAFEEATSIKVIYFPLNVESVGRYAFFGCTSLRSLYMYTTTPPTLEEYALSGLPNDAVIYVPSTSVPLFLNATGWSDYQIRSLNSEEKMLTVNFPSVSNMSDYQNMTLELINVQSNQVYRNLVTNRSTYTFFGLMKNSVYDLYLKTTDGVVLSKIEFINIKNDDVTVSLGSIARQFNVEVRVQAPQGNDVTNDVAVTWMDADGKYLRQGNIMTNQLVGENLSYQVKLSQSLAMDFVQPSLQNYVVGNQDSILTVTLQPIEKVTFTGKVKAANSNLGIYGANVSVVQTVNGKYSKTFTAQTDAKGVFSLQAYNVPASISVSAYDYVDKTITISEINVEEDAVVQIADILMKSIIGATVDVNLTYTNSVLEGDSAVTQNWYSDYQNVEYAIYNITQRQEVGQISNRFPQLVVMEGVKMGDQLRLTATSKKNAFMPVSATASVDTLNHVDVTFNIKQKGGIKVNYINSLNENNVAILYDEKGTFIQKKSFDLDGELIFNDLTDAPYTIVCMGESQYFNSISLLSRYVQTGLLENVDYVTDSITTQSGVIRSITIPTIPELDEQNFQYVGKQSSFYVNKSSIVAGNYLTFTGLVDLNATADQLSNVRMVVDIPSSAEFVEHSVMIGQKVVNTYSLEGSQLTISLSDYKQGQSVKFCVVPKASGMFYPNAYVGFSTTEKDYFLALGQATYEVEDISISVPKLTRNKFVPVRGKNSVPNSRVEIYDNGAMTTQFTMAASGEWMRKVELVDAYNLSKHNIYAKVILPNGTEVNSLVCETFYDQDANYVKDISMTHFNTHLRKNLTVVFNLEEGITTPKSCIFWDAEFSFAVNFVDNSPQCVDNVYVYVYTSDNQVVKCKATYNSSRDRWVASHEFASPTLPVNVSVDYETLCHSQKIDESEIKRVSEGDFLSAIEIMKERDSALQEMLTYEESELVQLVDSLIILLDDSTVEESVLDSMFGIFLSALDTLTLVESDSVDDNVELDWEQEARLYIDSLYDAFLLYNFTTIEPLLGDTSIIYSTEGGAYELSMRQLSPADTIGLTARGYQMYPVTDGSAIYCMTTDSICCVVDTKSMMQFSRRQLPSSRMSNAPYRAPELIHIAECLEALGATIKSFKLPESGGVDMALYLVSTLSSILDDFQCFYLSVYGQAKAHLEKKLQEKTKNIESSKQTNDKLIKYHLDDAKELLNNRNAIIESGDNAAIQKNKRGIEASLQSLRHCFDRVKQFDLKNAAAQKMYEQGLNQLNKLPSTFQPAVRLGRAVEVIGKLAGPFGVLVEIWACGNDFYDLMNKIQKWEELYNGILPCENNPQGALALADKVEASMSKVSLHTAGIILAEGGAILVDINGLTGLTLPGWFISGVLNGYAEITKNCAINNYDGELGNYYVEKNSLECYKKSNNTPEPPGDNNYPKPVPPVNNNYPAPITPPVTFILDPSGYVYEGVSSQRIEGATATVFYQSEVEDLYGVVKTEAVKWDASEFDQENPLFTDADGKYAWDVPQGLWQVKFEKEGYETTYSEWLPVPPPQLDVNIAMKQYRQPEVKDVHAYKEGVEIAFDMYMQPALLNTDNILLTANDAQIAGTVQLINEEVSYEGEETTYASIVRFVPDTPFTARTITLTVSNRVASYAGVRMQDNFRQTFDIEQEVTSLWVDSLITIQYGASKTITVTALPAAASAGKTLIVATGGSMIATTDTTDYLLDDSGQAQITIFGELPGTTGLVFTLEGTRLVANAIVQVKVAAEEVTYYTITATANHATIIGTGDYEAGTAATLTVIPDAGYQFVNWTDGDTSNPRTIIVTSDAYYEAVCGESIAEKVVTNEIAPRAIKQVINGQLVIIRDGVRYNVLGMVL